ncbi:hypothetical protein ACFQ0Q_13585 [Streptomyces aureus]
MSGSSMSRRTLLRSIAVGGAALAAPSFLTACSTDSGGGASVSNAGKKAAAWPTYTPATGAKPDLAATAEGVQAGYTTYPAKLVKAVAEKPGTGKEKVKVLSITYGTRRSRRRRTSCGRRSTKRSAWTSSSPWSRTRTSAPRWRRCSRATTCRTSSTSAAATSCRARRSS